MVSKVAEHWPVFTEAFIATLCHDLRLTANLFFFSFFFLVPYVPGIQKNTQLCFFEQFLTYLAHSFAYVTLPFSFINLLCETKPLTSHQVVMSLTLCSEAMATSC